MKGSNSEQRTSNNEQRTMNSERGEGSGYRPTALPPYRQGRGRWKWVPPVWSGAVGGTAGVEWLGRVPPGKGWVEDLLPPQSLHRIYLRRSACR